MDFARVPVSVGAVTILNYLMGYGLYTFVSSMGASVGPLAGGWLYDSVGRAVPFYLNGVVLLMGALLVLLLLGKKRLSS